MFDISQINTPISTFNTTVKNVTAKNTHVYYPKNKKDKLEKFLSGFKGLNPYYPPPSVNEEWWVDVPSSIADQVEYFVKYNLK